MAVGFFVATAWCGQAMAAELFVSGVHPDRRPENAPVISSVQKGADWDARYLHGIDKPLPPHLALQDQGAWYTPFNHRGMTPPYDPRGWWSAPGRKAAAQ